MIYDMGDAQNDTTAFGNNADIIETRILRRVDPIFYGVNRHAEPLTFSILFGSMTPLDRYAMEDIAMWLDSGHYKWLTVDEPSMEDRAYHCICTELTPVSHGWLTVAFRATFQCSTPYAHSQPWEYTYEISGSQDIIFNNEGSCREFLKPDLVLDGFSEISIVNEDDNNREFELVDIPRSCVVNVSNNNGIITTDAVDDYNLYEGFNMHFLRLKQGENLLHITGTGTLTIRGRFMYNVAA